MDDEALASFTAITGTAPARAQQYLNLADGILEQAIELFFANDGADLEGAGSPSTHPTEQASQVPPPVPASTRPGRPAAYDLDQATSDDDVEITGSGPPTEPRSRRRTPSSRTPAMAVPPVGAHDTLDDDEAMARRLQEEFYGSTGARDDINADEIRAPIARTTETLVGPGSFDPNDEEEMRAAVREQMQARQSRDPRRRDARPGIFNQRASASIWHDADNTEASHRAQLSRTTGGASESSSRSTMLAEMYRPPFEIMSRLSWDQARDEGKGGEKWLLVNIQDPSIFDCQVLNRDIWKHAGIMETVKENFIFMQYAKDDPRGDRYTQYYFQSKENADAYPHIAIVDPRTGEQVKVWSGLPAPKAPDFLMQLHEFLDRYSLKASAKNPVARRKPEAKKETRVETMTEEQMLEMAMQNSLAPLESSRRDSDPDELTRGVGNVDPSHVNGVEDASMADIEPTETNGSTTSPFASVSASNPHLEPATDAPSTRIQFRHPNGRVVRRFALSDPVRRIYEWLKASPLEGKEGVDFELICMGKNLIESLDQTIEEAGLKNSSVMVELLES